MMQQLEYLKDPEKKKKRRRTQCQQIEEKSEGHKIAVGSEADELVDTSEKSESVVDSREKSSEDRAEARDLPETVEEVKGSEANCG